MIIIKIKKRYCKGRPPFTRIINCKGRLRISRIELDKERDIDWGFWRWHLEGGKRVISQVRKLRWRVNGVRKMINNLSSYKEFKKKINFAIIKLYEFVILKFINQEQLKYNLKL